MVDPNVALAVKAGQPSVSASQVEQASKTKKDQERIKKKLTADIHVLMLRDEKGKDKSNDGSTEKMIEAKVEVEKRKEVRDININTRYYIKDNDLVGHSSTHSK